MSEDKKGLGDKSLSDLVHAKKDQMDESYRDSIGTVDKEGKRKWIFAKKPKGKWTNYRALVAYVLLAFLLIAPWLKVNGRPFLQIDVLDRRFIIFGQIFWPQDMHLFFFMMLAGIVFIVLFTVVFGRLFCGWVCPQTIFMEHVFRRIEYWIEGDYRAQKRLSEMPWNAEKIRKRGLKIFVFFGISFIISNTFLAYLIGVTRLKAMVLDPMANLGTLGALLLFTAVFYFVFAWFREQICIAICPYGRLQGVMLDRNSVVVAYDYGRGEPRGKKRKGADADELGDCIDCGLCVAVCPTGIDIRNGTQLECINCTACVDECNTVMDKIKRPKGLIRYASENQIADNKNFTFSTRIAGYTGVLTLLLGFIVFLLVTRNELEATILRAPGLMTIKRDDGNVSNLYTIKVVNKSAEEMNLTLKPLEIEGARIEMIGDSILRLEPQERGEGAFFVIVDPQELTKVKTDFKISVYENDRLITNNRTSFLKTGR